MAGVELEAAAKSKAAGTRFRLLLLLAGAALTAAAIASAVVPFQRVDSTVEVRARPEQSQATAPGADAGLEVERKTETTKPLPDALVAAALTGGLALLVLGILLGDVEEFAFAGWKIRWRLASEVATAAVEKARTEGLLEEGTVSVDVLEQVAEQSARAAVRADEMLDQRSTGLKGRARLSTGYVPPTLLRQLAKDAVGEEGPEPNQK